MFQDIQNRSFQAELLALNCSRVPTPLFDDRHHNYHNYIVNHFELFCWHDDANVGGKVNKHLIVELRRFAKIIRCPVPVCCYQSGCYFNWKLFDDVESRIWSVPSHQNYSTLRESHSMPCHSMVRHHFPRRTEISEQILGHLWKYFVR